MSFGNEIKDFVKAYTAAQANQSKNRYYDYMEEQARLRTKILEKKQQEADAPMNAYREGAKNAQGTTSGLKEGRSVAYGDPVADDLQPHQKAFLNAVAAPESGGKYNVRYNGDTPATFSGDQHPNILVPTDTGEQSSAAGRYQFTGSTWNEYGGGKFDPANQDRRAWELAQDRYGAVTGRPLDSDLRTRGLTPEMMQALSPTWQGFKTNPGLASDVYNDSLKRYAPPAPQAALPLPVSEQPAQYASLDDPNQEYLYEQPEYAASGGLIGDTSQFKGMYNRAFGNGAFGNQAFGNGALGNFRFPSLSANGMNIGGGIGSGYRPQLPNLGRTMQAIPGISSPMGGGYSGGLGQSSLQNLRATQAQQYNDLRAGNPGLPDISGMAQNYTQNGALPTGTMPNVSGLVPQGFQNYFNPAKLQQWLPHFKRGGFVDYGSDSSDDGGDTVDDSEMQQASTALDTISDGYGGGDSGGEDTPFSSVRSAVYDGLHNIQNTFGLTPGAVQTNAQGFQAFASGAGRASPELKRDVDKAVDPHDKMDDALRNMAGLDALYKFYRDRGEIGKAQAAVSSLLLAAQDTASRYGAAALRAPDAKSAGKLVAEGINKTVPGTKAELDENGNYTFTDPVTGEVKETGQLSPQKLLAAAMGLKDGTMYWKTLSNFADPRRADSAAQQKLRASAEADKVLQGGLQRALDTEGTPGAPPGAPQGTPEGAPATGAPTIPGTPAAVGAPATPTPAVPIDQQPTALADPAAVMPKAPVIPGGKLTASAAAAIVGKPPNLVQTLTPDEQRAFIGAKGSVQKNLQATYERHLIDRAQAKLSGTYQQPKEPTSAERNQITEHVDKAITDFDTAIVKPMNEKAGKKDTGLSPSDTLQLKSVAQHLMHGNPDMYANEAVEFGAKMAALPPNMPPIPVDENGKVDITKVPQGILPFRVIPATQEHGMLAQTKDGRTARITPKMREALIPVLQDSLQKRADEQQAKIKEEAAAKKSSERRSRAVDTMTRSAEKWITGLHPEGSMPMTTVPMD